MVWPRDHGHVWIRDHDHGTSTDPFPPHSPTPHPLPSQLCGPRLLFRTLPSPPFVPFLVDGSLSPSLVAAFPSTAGGSSARAHTTPSLMAAFSLRTLPSVPPRSARALDLNSLPELPPSTRSPITRIRVDLSESRDPSRCYPSYPQLAPRSRGPLCLLSAARGKSRDFPVPREIATFPLVAISPGTRKSLSLSLSLPLRGKSRRARL